MKVSDKNLTYTGDTIKIGETVLVEKGNTYNELICTLAMKISSMSATKFTSSCIKGCVPGKSYSTDETIRLLLDHVCNLSTSNIRYDGIYCNSGDNHYSQLSVPLMNRKLKWGLSVSGGTGVFTWNLGESLSSMPAGYSLSDAEVKVVGSVKAANTVVRKTANKAGSLSIPFDRFPVVVHVSGYIHTKDGNIEMVTKIPLSSPKSVSAESLLEVKDYTTVSSECTLTDMIDGMKADISGMYNYIKSLKEFSGGGSCGGSSLGIEGVLSNVISLADKTAGELKNISKK